MSATDLVATRLRTEEGFRALPYRDTKGKLTIGYGCNLDAGWSQDLGECVLEFQINDVLDKVASYWWWDALNDVRASVILDMAFNGGLGMLLHFPKMLAAVGAKDWQTAHDELLDSDAARELPARYSVLAQLMLAGA